MSERVTGVLTALALCCGLALCAADTAGAQGCAHGVGDCCEVHSIPGCDDLECCTAVCALDPFCCQSEWDWTCRNHAHQLCATCSSMLPCPGPTCTYSEQEQCGQRVNGDCYQGVLEAADASDVICGTLWRDNGTSDEDWYYFTISQQSRLEVKLYASGQCGVMLMTSLCDVGYGADWYGCPRTVQRLCAPPGLYRVGVVLTSSAGVACGSEHSPYVLEILREPCTIIECGFSEQDCCDRGTQPNCADSKCCESVCYFDPFCCTTVWDAICADEAWSDGDCSCVPDPPCVGTGGSCCVPHEGPGCDDFECCSAMCEFDSWCCQIEWDAICVRNTAMLPDACVCKKDWICTGDQNFDLIVDGADLGLLLGDWGTRGELGVSDINMDFTVDGADLGILLGSWGACPNNR